MATLQVGFKSEQLQKETGIKVILPEKRAENKPLSVLYLLHGFSGNEYSWCNQTSIQRYVQYKNIAVIMPDAFNSFYTDMACGVYNFRSYFINELMPFAAESFNLSKSREDSFIAGLSMGGYGAFKIALLYPERFSAAASFSGCMDISRLVKESDFSAVFGNTLLNEEDLFYLAKTVAQSEVKPRLFQWCGTGDFLYNDNIKFKNHVEKLGFDYTYRQSQGTHEWKYWDEQVRKLFAWLGIHNNRKE
ncbi:MAG: esterase family protein [Firmicutes bacterium]|nr:esterase family protein [Bacillota bacterium]